MDVPLKGSRDNRDIVDNDSKYSMKKYLRIGHVHGLKYLERNGKFETFFWTITILISSLLAGVFSAFLYVSSASTLVIKADLPARPIRTLPFPSITICSETKARQTFVNFTTAYHLFQDGDENLLSDEEISRVEAMSQVCDPHLFEEKKIRQTPASGKSLYETHKEISLQKGFLAFCRFQGDINNCDDLFEETVTDDGICYTFNKLKSQEMFRSNDASENPSWSLKSGYDNIEKNYLHRASPGADFGLNVVLIMSTLDLDFLCKGPIQGYKVRIHAPNEHPSMSRGYQRVGLNSESIIAVKPKVSLNQNIEGKNCHSTSTKTLKYFNSYSHENCMSECVSTHVETVCDCIKFTMIHDNSSNLCTQHDTKCISEAIKNFTLQNGDDFPCDCKPDCDELKFEAKMTEATYSFKNTFAVYKTDLEDEFPETAMSRLVVFMDDDVYVPTTNIPQDSSFELIAKLGGILAFFLGVSWISFIEVFYFFARRCFS